MWLVGGAQGVVVQGGVPVFVIFEAVNFKLKSIFHPSSCRMPGKYWMPWPRRGHGGVGRGGVAFPCVPWQWYV